METRLRPRYFVEVVVLAVVYHLVARLALQLAYVQANTTPVWPPSGIALAALLLLGMRYWPGIALGVVGGSLITGAPLPMALGLGLANTLEALAGAYLLNRLVGFHLALDRTRDVIGLAGAAAGSAALSASLGVATLRLSFGTTPAPIWTLWTTWWVGNVLGVLVVTSFILVWARHYRAALRRSFALEGVAFMGLLVLVSGFIFQNWSGTNIAHQALIYVIFPFAIWAALRLEQLGAVTAILAVSGIAIWGTVHGFGPFSGLPLNDSLVLLQTFTGVVALTALTLAASASERRQAEAENAWLFDQVRLGNDQLRALSQRLIGLQEQERAHLSRELHDEAGQILSALTLRLSLLEREAEAPHLWREQIAELKEIVTGVLNNLHTLAVKLRPASLDHVGLVTALQQYAQDYGSQHGLNIQFDALEIAGLRLPPDTETALFRIVQESLANVVLHARASRVDVLLNRRSGCVAVTIEDDGIGFDPAQAARQDRLGLFGMRERVEMLGGSLAIESAPGKGTTILVEVPDVDSRADRR